MPFMINAVTILHVSKAPLGLNGDIWIPTSDPMMHRARSHELWGNNNEIP